MPDGHAEYSSVPDRVGSLDNAGIVAVVDPWIPAMRPYQGGGAVTTTGGGAELMIAAPTMVPMARPARAAPADPHPQQPLP